MSLTVARASLYFVTTSHTRFLLDYIFLRCYNSVQMKNKDEGYAPATCLFSRGGQSQLATVLVLFSARLLNLAWRLVFTCTR